MSYSHSAIIAIEAVQKPHLLFKVLCFLTLWVSLGQIETKQVLKYRSWEVFMSCISAYAERLRNCFCSDLHLDGNPNRQT